MVETKQITGEVQVARRNGRRLLLCVGDQWFSGFGDQWSVNRGDTVTVSYTEVEKGGRTYFNIADVQVEKPASRADAEPSTDRVLRSVALKAACVFLQGSTTDSGEVLALAGRFHEWLASPVRRGQPAAAVGA